MRLPQVLFHLLGVSTQSFPPLSSCISSMHAFLRIRSMRQRGKQNGRLPASVCFLKPRSEECLLSLLVSRNSFFLLRQQAETVSI